jgi:hypothetical protein
MLGLGMHHWIFGDIDSTSVVTEYWNGLIILHLYILQGFLYLEKLSTTCCCCNGFFFCYR